MWDKEKAELQNSGITSEAENLGILEYQWQVMEFRGMTS